MIEITKTENGCYLRVTDRDEWNEWHENWKDEPQYIEYELIDQLVQWGIVECWEPFPGLTEAPAFWYDGELYGFMDYMLVLLTDRLNDTGEAFCLRGTE